MIKRKEICGFNLLLQNRDFTTDYLMKKFYRSAIAMLMIAINCFSLPVYANSANELPSVVIGSSKWITNNMADFVSLESYSKDTAERELCECLENNMDSYINSILQNYPEYTPSKDSVVSNDDYVNISIEAYVDGEEEPSISIDNLIIRVGAGDLPDELEIMLPKKKVGSTVDIYMTSDQSPLYKKTRFTVTINSIVDTKFYTSETLTENYVINTLNFSSVEEFKQKLGYELNATLSGKMKEETAEILSKYTISDIPVKLVAQLADQHRQLIIRQAFDGDEKLYQETISLYENMSVNEYENNIFEQFKVSTPYILTLFKIAQEENICTAGDGYNTYIDELMVSGNFETKEKLFRYYDTTYESGEVYLKRQYMIQEAEKLFTEHAISKICADVSIHKGPSLNYNVPANRGFKSFMGYNTITSKSSDQYKLQQIATTSYTGIRMVDGRYCIAVGTHFGTKIGQYIDLVLANGTVINCIRGDVKADVHTDISNIFTTANGCCSEFIIDPETLVDRIKLTGNMSNLYEEWNSPIVCIKVYDTIAEF